MFNKMHPNRPTRFVLLRPVMLQHFAAVLFMKKLPTAKKINVHSDQVPLALNSKQIKHGLILLSQNMPSCNILNVRYVDAKQSEMQTSKFYFSWSTSHNRFLTNVLLHEKNAMNEIMTPADRRKWGVAKTSTYHTITSHLSNMWIIFGFWIYRRTSPRLLCVRTIFALYSRSLALGLVIINQCKLLGGLIHIKPRRQNSVVIKLSHW